MRYLIPLCAMTLGVGLTSVSPARAPAERLDALVQRFIAQELARDPTLTYSTGLPTNDHSRFADRRPPALAAFDAQERADLDQLRAIDPTTLPPAALPTYANLKEQLESDLQLRVCKIELWNVNHFDGWLSSFAEVAQQQPVATPAERAQAIKRWSSITTYVEVEVVNLRHGLAAGYSAPRAVVQRVIKQLDDLVAAAPEAMPLYSPAARSADAGFKSAFTQVVTARIDPALKHYREFLAHEYLPHAREGVAISDLPDGPRCYAAFLRASTTLQRTPQEVFDLGERTVATNVAEATRLAHELFGISNSGSSNLNIATIVRTIKSRPESHFTSKEELVAYSQQVLANARRKTASDLVDRMPQQDVVIRPEAGFEEAVGVSSHFVTDPDPTRPGVFYIQLNGWASLSRGEAEITVVHEAWPGHALQKSLARELQPASPMSQLVENPAYSEGWARYAEALAEEAGLYSKDALILRRVWPARGMVVDPGLHAMHWSRQQAIDYLVSTGRYDTGSADDYVDRMAVMPGQLTSYDSGGLEIRALRQEAQTRLGAAFNLRQFNHVLLEEGVVPLGELRRHVEDWVSVGVEHRP
jgi:uncharacterized protein (DUF885 family)